MIGSQWVQNPRHGDPIPQARRPHHRAQRQARRRSRRAGWLLVGESERAGARVCVWPAEQRDHLAHRLDAALALREIAQRQPIKRPHVLFVDVRAAAEAEGHSQGGVRARKLWVHLVHGLRRQLPQPGVLGVSARRQPRYPRPWRLNIS